MGVNVSGRPNGGDESDAPPVEGVAWLPRARLRSGARGDRLLTSLTILTACVLATAAGVAAYARHGDLVSFDLASLQIFSGEQKTPERAPLAVQPPPPTVRTVAPAPQPSLRGTTQPEPPARAEVEAPRRSSERVMPDGSLAPPPASLAPEPAREPKRLAAGPDPAPPAPRPPVTTPTAIERPEPVRPPAPVFDPVPPIPSSTASAPSVPPTAFAPSQQIAAPAPRPPETPAPAARAAAPQPPAQPRQPVVVASSQPAAPAREAAAPAPAGGKVAIYLDEFDDQKAAAAGLTQKQGKYAPLIGSAGKLTYSRRLGNAWRLRVSNLDQSTAEAVCAKLKGAGAPCAVGPN